ncbi:hypothetical protein F511_31400 [Dorcoceras hygrometricum]|uniref:Uncharacterized protein n=1 Tax=Dorcoceras hygrometricum TaxID=472368 RepID=A0A2Z7B5J4_9LAMI|nr:hypothetical protein F511_31400 [Dorcoceras hygrometricum]
MRMLSMWWSLNLDIDRRALDAMLALRRLGRSPGPVTYLEPSLLHLRNPPWITDVSFLSPLLQHTVVCEQCTLDKGKEILDTRDVGPSDFDLVGKKGKTVKKKQSTVITNSSSSSNT